MVITRKTKRVGFFTILYVFNLHKNRENRRKFLTCKSNTCKINNEGLLQV